MIQSSSLNLCKKMELQSHQSLFKRNLKISKRIFSTFLSIRVKKLQHKTRALQNGNHERKSSVSGVSQCFIRPRNRILKNIFLSKFIRSQVFPLEENMQIELTRILKIAWHEYGIHKNVEIILKRVEDMRRAYIIIL